MMLFTKPIFCFLDFWLIVCRTGGRMSNQCMAVLHMPVSGLAVRPDSKHRKSSALIISSAMLSPNRLLPKPVPKMAATPLPVLILLYRWSLWTGHVGYQLAAILPHRPRHRNGLPVRVMTGRRFRSGERKALLISLKHGSGSSRRPFRFLDWRRTPPLDW